MTRTRIIQEILSQCPKGRKPFLQVIIDLTTLEKFGKFKSFKNLITVYNGKRGLHLVVMYLVVGQWRERVEFSCLERKRDGLTCTVGIKASLMFTVIFNQTFQGHDFGRYSFWKRRVSAWYT